MQCAQSMRVRRSLTVTCRQPRSGSPTKNKLTTPPRLCSSAAQRLADQEPVAHAPTLVLVVLAWRPPRRQRQGRADLAEELAAGLIQAELRATRVIGAGVDRQHVLHPPAELGVVLGWDAPA